MSYSIESVRQAISPDQIFSLLDYLGAEPRWQGDNINCLTICHENGDSRKLYFYANSNLFHCYTHCGSFDVVELVQKTQRLETNDAVNWLVSFFHLENELEDTDYSAKLEDWKIFQEWKELMEYKPLSHELISLPTYDVPFLKNYPKATPEMVDKNISQKVLNHYGFRYDPVNGCWIVPHTDKDGRIVGVRRRALRDYDVENFGKYRPWRHNDIEYSHPLGNNLFADNHFWENIRKIKTAIVFEAEKSVAQVSTYYGIRKSCSCAVCGSNFSEYQYQLLTQMGVESIIIGYDRDYIGNNIDADDFRRYVNKIYNVWKRYNSRCNLSFIIDRHNQLGYKDSPTDKGKAVFQSLLDDRRVLTENDFKVLDY